MKQSALSVCQLNFCTQELCCFFLQLYQAILSSAAQHKKSPAVETGRPQHLPQVAASSTQEPIRQEVPMDPSEGK